MKKTLTAILAGFIATAGLYAQTASFDEGYWITPAPALSATPLPSLFSLDGTAFSAAAQPMQAGVAVEWPPSMLSVGLNFALFSSFRGFSQATVQERTRTTEYWVQRLSYLGIGAFFDARYVELAVGISFVVGGWSREISGNMEETDSIEFFFPLLDFSLLFKLPLELPFGGYVFPLLGVEYDIMWFVRLEDQNTSFNTFRIQFGAGLDVPVGSNVFFRTSLLLHYTLASSGNMSHSSRWGISLPFGIGFGFRL
ncbi:MAG: hypothetical protein FWC64_09015 [Treponema sp.]|nr:hypothetical protein [Treponema sp.]